MDAGSIKLNKIPVRRQEDGKDYVSMMVPEGCTSTVTVYPDRYQGYGYPYFFTVKNLSADKTWSTYYLSPCRYREDYLKEKSDFSKDLYGNCHRHFLEASAYIDHNARLDLKNVENLTMIRQIPYTTNQKILNERGPKKEEEARNNGLELKRYYYYGLVQEYSYTSNGRKRIRAYSAVVEGEDLERIATIPYQITKSFNDPFMAPIAQMAKQMYTNCRYDNSQGWIYTLMHYMDWRVTGKYVLDAREEDFETLYNKVFLPTIRGGANISETIWADFKAKQNSINQANKADRDKNEAKRQEEKRIRDQERAAADAKRERDRAFRENLRKTQQEIHDIQKSAWENTQKSQDKVREMWGDTIRGDTRFVDKYGNEHVIRTYDKYAYKSGDTYITSDSPLDHGWDWEELEKKKY